MSDQTTALRKKAMLMKEKIKKSKEMLSQRQKKMGTRENSKSTLLQDIVFQQEKLMRPKDNQNFIDILVYEAGENDPVVSKGDVTFVFSYFTHYIDKKYYLCPKMTYGKPCPVCEEREKQIAKGAEKEDLDAMNLNPKQREMYYVWVRTTSEERDKGPQILETSFFLMGKELAQKAKKPLSPDECEELIEKGDEAGTLGFIEIDYYLPTTEGKTVSFEAKKKSIGDNKSFTSFENHQFVDRKKDIPDNILMSATPPLDELVKIPTYQELELAWHGENRSKEETSSDEDYDDYEVPDSSEPSTDSEEKKGEEDSGNEMLNKVLELSNATKGQLIIEAEIEDESGNLYSFKTLKQISEEEKDKIIKANWNAIENFEDLNIFFEN